jgi:hypothetical protein
VWGFEKRYGILKRLTPADLYPGAPEGLRFADEGKFPGILRQTGRARRAARGEKIAVDKQRPKRF